ncbi:MAG TPA: AAA family ATPase [Rhodocyclaceae bacterium]|nr:AAA family ATPase [Rhodocyclaceae bacterium]
MPDHQQLVNRLRRPAAYPHPVAQVACIETHISWVLLAGDYAYKLKKPLDLGFLDFSTAALRHAACRDEVRLNRRTAPQLYLDVVTINGPVEAPTIGGHGEVLDHAVRMRRFDQAGLFANLLAAGRLSPSLIDAVAQHVAAFHAAADVADAAAGFGTADAVHFPVRQNFDQIRVRIDDAALRARLERLAQWSEAQFTRLAAVFGRRLADARVRECHGDLHLGNLVLLDGAPHLFDAIEFSASLRWIDVIADVAFLVMDLEARERSDLAHRFLNAYLERSGDYDGLHVLDYYLVYRAMVRAKVAAIRLAQVDGDERAECLAQLETYVALAERHAQPVRAALLIACGVSGSGKTSASQALVEARGVIRVRSDVERKRLVGLAPEARSGAALGTGLYDAEAGRRTYARLAELAATVLAARPVLVDATFLKRAQRDAFRRLAREHGVPFVILAFEAPPAVLRERVRRRAAAGTDASEADLAVLDAQLADREPLTGDETGCALVVATEPQADWAALLPRLDLMLAAGASPRGRAR